VLSDSDRVPSLVCVLPLCSKVVEGIFVARTSQPNAPELVQGDFKRKLLRASVNIKPVKAYSPNPCGDFGWGKDGSTLIPSVTTTHRPTAATTHHPQVEQLLPEIILPAGIKEELSCMLTVCTADGVDGSRGAPEYSQRRANPTIP